MGDTCRAVWDIKKEWNDRSTNQSVHPSLGHRKRNQMIDSSSTNQSVHPSQRHPTAPVVSTSPLPLILRRPLHIDPSPQIDTIVNTQRFHDQHFATDTYVHFQFTFTGVGSFYFGLYLLRFGVLFRWLLLQYRFFVGYVWIVRFFEGYHFGFFDVPPGEVAVALAFVTYLFGDFWQVLWRALVYEVSVDNIVITLILILMNSGLGWVVVVLTLVPNLLCKIS